MYVRPSDILLAGKLSVMGITQCREKSLSVMGITQCQEKSLSVMGITQCQEKSLSVMMGITQCQEKSLTCDDGYHSVSGLFVRKTGSLSAMGKLLGGL